MTSFFNPWILKDISQFLSNHKTNFTIVRNCIISKNLRPNNEYIPKNKGYRFVELSDGEYLIKAKIITGRNQQIENKIDLNCYKMVCLKNYSFESPSYNRYLIIIYSFDFLNLESISWGNPKKIETDQTLIEINRIHTQRREPLNPIDADIPTSQQIELSRSNSLSSSLTAISSSNNLGSNNLNLNLNVEFPSPSDKIPSIIQRRPQYHTQPLVKLKKKKKKNQNENKNKYQNKNQTENQNKNQNENQNKNQQNTPQINLFPNSSIRKRDNTQMSDLFSSSLFSDQLLKTKNKQKKKKKKKIIKNDFICGQDYPQMNENKKGNISEKECKKILKDLKNQTNEFFQQIDQNENQTLDYYFEKRMDILEKITPIFENFLEK
ncbi:mkpa protein [Anaeramoeba flamelloides]|uniref:Mkpa protein n=1 Tax=Anaeramoeba flamelloides TaxID=1746091 RepID=A0AAV8A8F9_9EUKA|nr:mkpa protein [Anaeramoeba flamelloides]